MEITAVNQETIRLYTHSFISYASLEEIQPLLDFAKHWAYIYHNRTEGVDNHYHIVATFGQHISFKKVKEIIISTQNTFVEDIKYTVGNVLTYFLHKTNTAINENKEQYNDDDIKYDDEEYWKKRAITEGETWKGSTRSDKPTNKEFLSDLLTEYDEYTKSEWFSSMAVKYGRDFIKNTSTYLTFRERIMSYKQEEELYNSFKELCNNCTDTMSVKYYAVYPNGEIKELSPDEYIIWKK